MPSILVVSVLALGVLHSDTHAVEPNRCLRRSSAHCIGLIIYPLREVVPIDATCMQGPRAGALVGLPRLDEPPTRVLQ
jgi:hypothetical protein